MARPLIRFKWLARRVDSRKVGSIGNLAIVGNGFHGFLVSLAGPVLMLISAIPDENDGSGTSISAVLVSVYLMVLFVTLGTVVAPYFWHPVGRSLAASSGLVHVAIAAAIVVAPDLPILLRIGLALWPGLVGVGLIGHARSADSPSFA